MNHVPGRCWKQQAYLLSCLAAGIGAFSGSAHADMDGRALYDKHCVTCHGLIAEQSADGGGLVHQAAFAAPQQLAIVPPYGPPLTAVYNRPAGTIAGFRYSQSFQEATKDIVWQEGTLDTWLTNSQAMIRGSYMFFKMPDPDIRQKIIAYLEQYAPHKK